MKQPTHLRGVHTAFEFNWHFMVIIWKQQDGEQIRSESLL